MTDSAPLSTAGARMDATVPQKFMAEFEQDSLRLPPHLDHGAIVRRLGAIRESCSSYRDSLAELTRLLEDVERMSAVQVASRVLAALAWTEDNPGYGFLAEQLQIVALNLKNLRPD